MVIEGTKMGSSVTRDCKLDRKRKPKFLIFRKSENKQSETKIIYLKAMENKYIKR